MNEITFKEISAYKAIKEVYRHKKAWNFLLDFIDGSEEIDYDEEGNLVFVYYDDKSVDENYYTNEKEYCWVAGYDRKKLVFLQLLRRWSKFHIELVIAQKNRKSEAANLFGLLIDYIRKEYPKTKWLSTFPMNDRLKEYYKLNGFKDWKKELKLEL